MSETPSRPNIQLRAAVAQRAFYCCEYCRAQEKYSPDTFSVEHIIPQSKGRKTELENLAYACQGCNNHKYTKTTAYDPATGILVELYKPRQHVWNDHFRWNADFSEILGITPVGRATVAQIQLNREGLVNMRKILAAVNLHPPSESA